MIEPPRKATRPFFSFSNFINEFGESLINIIENCTIRIQDVQTATDSAEFRQYQESMESAGFNQSEITQIEHTLFAKGLIGENLFVESNYQITKIVEEYTAQEISDLMNIPRGTILSILHRTKQKLKVQLTEKQV